MLEVVCAGPVGGSLFTSLLYITIPRGYMCMSSGRLSIVHRCFILGVLEVVCACSVGGSVLYIVAVYCED